ncbi:MAG TPA: GrlR family regulatory protein [Xanthobacteraceae bacterium]|jgi:hypothetical protein|nr:GrlR family regulatory protein [Xanthobacteraceae bacterium]
MKNGLYKVEFETPLGTRAGIVFLQDGKIRGGDSAMFYVGTLTENGEDLAADVQSRFHTMGTGVASVFGPEIKQAHLTLKGKAFGTAATFWGNAAEAPDVSFQARVRRISD